MALFNGPQCNPGIIVALNDTASQVCGLTSSNTSAIGSCCGRSGDGMVHEYSCSHYCNTGLSLQEFVDCLIEEGSENEDSIVNASPYCQRGITSNTTERLTSFGIPRSRPGFGYMFWILALGFMSAGQVLGAIVPSISSNVLRRQSTTTCSIDIHNNYTTTGQSRLVSGDFDCQGTRSFCIQNIPVDSGLHNNNRTVNDTSAAEPKFDEFFEMLQNQTGRQFPALSSVELNLDLVVMSGDFSIGFTPLRWCINGTVSGCAGVVGDDNGFLPINACGPLFVSDYAGNSDRGEYVDAIQGVIGPVYHGVKA